MSEITKPNQESSAAIPATRPGSEPSSRPSLQEILDDLARLRYDTQQAASAGARLAHVAQPSFLLRLMRDRNPLVRFAAVEALRLGDFVFSKGIIDTLLARIDDRQTYIAVAAMKALGRKQVSEAEEELISCLSMEDSKIAAAALLALSEIGSAEIAPYVGEYLESNDPIRIRAAANVIGQQQLTQFAEPALNLIRQLSDRAEVIPHASHVNQHLFAVRALIAALDALQYTAAIPILKPLSIDHIGLRSSALRALHHMGVNIVDLACQAYDLFPSANISRLLSELSDDFDGDDIDLIKLNQHLGQNRQRLADFGDEFAPGTVANGQAIRVRSGYAIIQLQQGVSAYLPAEEYRWSVTPDLLRFESSLQQETQYKIVEIDRTRGKITVSKRKLYPDPLIQFQADQTPHETVSGIIDGIRHYGLFVQVHPDIIGLLHVSEIDIAAEQDLQEVFTIGDAIKVAVKSIDLQRRRLRLGLA